ncbi:MAG: hypothetical protein IPM63_16730 [Acidobacteriota bacterium]|nr:MAG: hypothetical protein IPM63_16730 [Acidobacteriota bacterium]
MTENNNKNREGTEDRSGKIEQVRAEAAEGVGGAAGAVRKRTDSAHDYLSEQTEAIEETFKEKTEEAADAARELLERSRQAGYGAADRIDSASDYLRDVDLNEVRQRAAERVRENPAIVIASAGIAGLLIGYLLGRKIG